MPRSPRQLGLVAAVLLAAAPARAEDPAYQTLVEDEPSGDAALPEDRASTTVQPSDLERRMPRSAPDALRWEPGVFVQQTGHGQGSVFLRGLTGQQTLILFDGIRLNNSTYRQGPNQYFFTLDARSIDSLEVLRGGASTRYGSDAIGGVVLARPIDAPAWDEARARPRLTLRGTTADEERGGRLQLEAAAGAGAGFVGGLGGRTVGLLESAGPIASPATGEAPQVPRYDLDGRKQLGTGFDEWTADGRVVLRRGRHAVTAAAYAYRQYDAPRTDQCPPAYARWDECFRYEEQFRTLAYAAWSGAGLGAPAAAARVTLSFQRQHERRRGERPASYVVSRGEDDVDTFGVTANATTRWWRPGAAALRLEWGADTYHDVLGSRASIGFTDIDVTEEQSRGQYLDGSTYTYGGAFVDGEARLPRRVTLRAGGRLSWIRASAPADPISGSQAVDRGWLPLVGHAGATWAALPWLALMASVDRSFRAPNLDDMTSRQQTGPGFQFENAGLDPERATSFELGMRMRRGRVAVDAWGFHTRLTGAIGKAPREAEECPPETPACEASWSRFQLVNAGGVAEIWGVEGAARVRLPHRVTVRATAAWAWGEGENLAERPSDPSLPWEERVPLSRIPPLNGTVEAYVVHRSGFTASAGVRWATLQDRLAVADRSDTRIPAGGTPGFAVVDLRVSYRRGTLLAYSLAVENLFDTAYRYHGSSINGAGRGVVVAIELAPF